MKFAILALLLALTSAAIADDRPLVFIDFNNGLSSQINSEGIDALRPDLMLAPSAAVAPNGPVRFGIDVGKEKVSAVQFLITGPQGFADSADLSNCDAYLPQTHIGGCKISGDGILFYTFSPVNAELNTGFLGEIRLGRNFDVSVLGVAGEVMGDPTGAEIK